MSSSSLRRRTRKADRPARNGVLFEQPRLYDLAFGFRDTVEQCDGLLALARHYGMKAPHSVLELCCGQAHHLREFARRKLKAYGVDANREMLAYARMLCKRDRVSVRFVRADIRSFELPERVDLAYCLFDSFCHCTTDEDAVATLRATGAALRRGRLLILELTHPADFFAGVRARGRSRWVQRFPGVTVTTRFRHTNVNPVTETFAPSITIDAHYHDSRPTVHVVDRLDYRIWLPGNLKYVAAASGCFDIVGWHGDLTPNVPLNMSEESWQMVVVLRKR
jgi:SAM-dependent methyltransferase